MEIKFKKYWRRSSFKNKKDGNFLLRHIEKIKPKNFLEIGVFHGVTSRNVCEILYSLHGNDFKFTGIDLFSEEITSYKDEFPPKTAFSNPLKLGVIPFNPPKLSTLSADQLSNKIKTIFGCFTFKTEIVVSFSTL